ncbi:alpha/beta fold hydrolase [Actinocrispum sp. NPDC049592]|uniref:alpha/beta fold hydrolase n=1 Tax=Actinocrispum sp. NPDC049592 TaxID=3154835 RepID=UPI0034227E8A
MSSFDRGDHEFRGLMGSAPQQMLADLRERAPKIYDAIITGFRETIGQPELSRYSRELATVAMLAALGGAEPQLTLHTQAALRNGVEPDELIALCEHIYPYAGMPRALNALTVIDKVLTDAGHPRPAPLKTVQLGDHETVVAQRGDTGTAVLLVHAISLDWRMWEPVMNELGKSRRVFAYDLRGHGRAMGAPAATSMNEYTSDLVGVLDALDLDRAHVVGLSFGGGVAQAAAVTHPERFASLSLLATGDTPNDEVFENRAVAGETEGMAAQIVPSLTRWFTPAALAANGWGVKYARERMLRANPADWAATWRAFKTLDVHGKLGTFESPVLVVAGEADLSATPASMREIAGRIPGSRFEELPGTPHMLSLEQPALVAETLGRFIP